MGTMLLALAALLSVQPPSEVQSLTDRWKSAVEWHDAFTVHVNSRARRLKADGTETGDSWGWDYDAAHWVGQGGLSQDRRAGRNTFRSFVDQSFEYLRTQYGGEDLHFEVLDAGTPWGRAYDANPAYNYGNSQFPSDVCFGLGVSGLPVFLSKPIDLFTPDNTEVSREALDGIECDVLHAKTKQGDLTVWLAPQYGYSPVKFKVVKESGKHLMDDGKVYQDMVWTDDGKVLPAKLTTIEISIAQFTELNGKYVPAEAAYVMRIEGSGTAKIMSYTIAYTNPDLAPQFTASSFAPDFPEGTDLWFEDRVYPEGYTFQHGKIVHEVEKDLVAAIEQDALPAEPGHAPAVDAPSSTAVAPVASRGHSYYGWIIAGGAGILTLCLILYVIVRVLTKRAARLN
ncbi:MAG TPA: hypothetical protein VMZ06_15475 [Candidatus Bathyarchaeia archaeon]|nr:hypothetical protein [Candidatus Bathyarchaeia archaeon]